MRWLALAVLLALSCASAGKPDDTPDCWRMTGSGEIGSVDEGYLCVLLRDSECWTCVEAPLPPEGWDDEAADPP